jgi:energy-coupling factor transporter ATP-binding protein EcfA2
MSVLEFDRVSYAYPGAATPVLRDVTVSVEPGELVIVAGSSGAGKSTFLRAACGLVPHFHGGTFAGRVTVAGRDTHAHGPSELAGRVGVLFQDPETQVVMGTVRAELAFPLENAGQPPAVVARGVEEIALALRIAHLLDRSTAELSGGELQRVGLGAALVGRPALVVLDEPTSQLDPVAGDELLGLLRRWNEDFDTAILLCEHRLERCLGAADRVIALADGQVVCDSSPERFLGWAGTAAPALQTPGARLLAGLGLPPAAGVKHARATLRASGQLPAADAATPHPSGARGPRWRSPRRAPHPPAALELRGVWHELRSGPVILRDVSVRVEPGERVALMGRNGAGKSTLLRHAAGLVKPTRGRVSSAGRVALLLQNPNDYLVHARVADEAPSAALARAGLAGPAFAQRHPRELSGGERQRLALAVVLGDGSEAAAVLCLDEPTRGMDRSDKAELATLLAGWAGSVVVATHDPEFAAAFASRVILLADGGVIADGPVATVLSGGSYFATETARILGGWESILTPEQALAALPNHGDSVVGPEVSTV